MSRGDPERVPDLAAVSGRDSADTVSSLNCGQTQAVRLQLLLKGRGRRTRHIGMAPSGRSSLSGQGAGSSCQAGHEETNSGHCGLQAGMSTGWAGPENQVVMTVDFATRADFDVP